MIETLYTVGEAANILRKSVKTIRNYISARKITVYKGRPVLIPESAIKEFLTRRKSRAI